MEITVNQQKYQVPEKFSIEDLLKLLMPQAKKGIAVAVNQEVVPKGSWPHHLLSSSDNIVLIAATQGG